MKLIAKLFAIITLAVACFYSPVAAQKLDFYTEPGTDFSKFKTYKWGRADKAIYPAKDLDEMFIRTLDAELGKKGLVRTDSDDADLVATYQIAVLDDMEWSAAPGGWIGVPGMYMGVRGASVSSTNLIQKGSFIFDLYDRKARQQVWQAHATKTLADTTDLKKREKNTRKVMAKIFKEFRPVQNKDRL